MIILRKIEPNQSSWDYFAYPLQRLTRKASTMNLIIKSLKRIGIFFQGNTKNAFFFSYFNATNSKYKIFFLSIL